MLILSDDIILLLWEYYIKKNIKCTKNSLLINKLFACKKLYNIYKQNKSMFKLPCKLLNLSKVNYTICGIHDEIGIKFAEKIVGQIDKYISLQKTPNNMDLGFNFHTFHVSNFIHCPDLQKNEIFVKKILKKYGLTINKYCCNGDGCELKKIKLINPSNKILFFDKTFS